MFKLNYGHSQNMEMSQGLYNATEIGESLVFPSGSVSIQDEGFTHGADIPDDFKLWLSRHPGLIFEIAVIDKNKKPSNP